MERILELNKGLDEEIILQQYDKNSEKIRIKIEDSKYKYDLTGYTISINGIKPDEKYIMIPVNIINAKEGIIEFDIVEQLTIVSGVVTLQFMLLGSGSKVINSTLFSINVKPSIKIGTPIASADDFILITQTLKEVKEWDTIFTQKIKETNDRISEIVANNGNGNKDSEIVDARKGKASLRDKVNEIDANIEELQEKAISNVKEIGEIYDRFNEAELIEYTGTNITAKNSYKGLLREVSIKGRTIQNLIQKEYKISEQFRVVAESSLLKPNTTYTLIVENTSSNSYGVYFGEKVFESTPAFRISKGVNMYVARTKSDITDSNVLKNHKDNTEYTLKNIMLLEGDHTNTPLSEIPYIEGIKSVGEEENNKIGILGKNKNLFDAKTFVDDTNREFYSYSDDRINILKLDGRANKERFKKRVRIKPNTDYIIKCNLSTDAIRIFLYEDNVYITPTNYAFNSLGNQWIDIKFIETTIFPKEVLNIQLEEGKVASVFVKGETQKSDIQLTEPLRSLPNGVSDEIKDGKLIRRVGSVILDGSENWRKNTNWGVTDVNTSCFNFDRVGHNGIDISRSEYSLAFLCDKLPSINPYAIDLEGCISHLDNIRLRILKSKLDTDDSQGIKKYLISNNIELVYELKTPIITDLKPLILNSYDGTTHITSDNYIMPTITAKVPSNVQAIISDLNIENEELKKDNTLQNEAINTGLYATDEMYYLLEPIISAIPQSLELTEDGKDRIEELHRVMRERGLTPRERK